MPLITLNLCPVKRGKLFFAVAIILTILCKLPAYGQIDYSFGRNASGLRLGAGAGVTQLNSRYSETPHIACFIGTLDYEFNPYFSMGVEGQIGTLQGIDNTTPPTQYYHASTNDFQSINFNMKFGLGLISDFRPENKFQDVVKRTYIGIGAGLMHNNIVFSRDTSLTDTYTADTKTWGYTPIIPINIGTYIDMGNVLGYDRLEINPNLQFTYVNSPYGDGFKLTDNNVKTFYSLLSLTIKLKF